MPSSLVGDILQVTFRGRYEQQRIMLVHHYRLDAVNPFTDAQNVQLALADKVRAGAGGGNIIEGSYLACLPPQYTLEKIRTQTIALQRLVMTEVARNVPGTHGGDTETGNQAAVVTLRTALAGRSQVSNKHIGPIPQDVTVQDNGLVTVAYKALLTTLASNLAVQFADAGTGATFTPVIFHKTGTGPNYSVIERWLAQETLRVMRRRTVGLGE